MSSNTLLDQFKSAVDMMQQGGAQYVAVPTAPQAAPMAAQMAAPYVPPVAQYVPAAAVVAAAPAPAKQNFLSKNWPIVLGVGLVLVATVVGISVVVKKNNNKKKNAKSGRRRHGDDDDEDDDERPPQCPVMPLGRPHPQQQPMQQQQQVPRLPPVASQIPTAQDGRYSDGASLRGAPMAINTRGADSMMQPPAQSGLPLVQPQPQPQQPLPMPPPQQPPMLQQQQQPPPQASSDPNFTKL